MTDDLQPQPATDGFRVFALSASLYKRIVSGILFTDTLAGALLTCAGRAMHHHSFQLAGLALVLVPITLRTLMNKANGIPDPDPRAISGAGRHISLWANVGARIAFFPLGIAVAIGMQFVQHHPNFMPSDATVFTVVAALIGGALPLVLFNPDA